ncbi:MAG: hypothetical protein QUV07_08730 [Cyanobium sp. CZS 25K]|nr:hypothetical protein [Cyanobium sp. CZS25K]
MDSLDPWQRRLSDLQLDLQLDLRIDLDKLSEQVGSLERLEGLMAAGTASASVIDSAAVRLQRAIALWPWICSDLGRFQAGWTN